jgi:hypothetical protein
MARKASYLPSSAALASTLAFAVLAGCENPSTAPDVLTPVVPTSSFAPSAKPPSKRPSKPPPEQDSFTDFLDAYDTSRWMKADGLNNAKPES